MWEPRRLTVIWASTACYRDNFIFFFLRSAEHDWLKNFRLLTIFCTRIIKWRHNYINNKKLILSVTVSPEANHVHEMYNSTELLNVILKVFESVRALNRRYIQLLLFDSCQSLLLGTLLVIIFPIQLHSGCEYLFIIYYDQRLYTEFNLLYNNFTYLFILFTWWVISSRFCIM
jgi:hypothetical protein